jgi:hypothetical protein
MEIRTTPWPECRTYENVVHFRIPLIAMKMILNRLVDGLGLAQMLQYQECGIPTNNRQQNGDNDDSAIADHDSLQWED